MEILICELNLSKDMILIINSHCDNLTFILSATILHPSAISRSVTVTTLEFNKLKTVLKRTINLLNGLQRTINLLKWTTKDN